jgi:signal transduction histidine kinase
MSAVNTSTVPTRPSDEQIDELLVLERSALLTRVISMIAHELGTPLNVITGRASMIASGEASGEDALENARLILKQAGRITTIIREMLGHARKRRSEKGPVAMVELFSQAFSLIGGRASTRSVELMIDPECEPITLLVERGRFLLVVKNLVANAIQAMPKGGTVTVGIRRESSPPAGEPSRLAEGYYCLYVRDQGTGIAKEDLHNIFKPFFTSGDSEGTGLGLAVVHGVVREHGGWIDVESEVGVGSTFKICLPEGVVQCKGVS